MKQLIVGIKQNRILILMGLSFLIMDNSLAQIHVSGEYGLSGYKKTVGKYTRAIKPNGPRAFHPTFGLVVEKSLFKKGRKTYVTALLGANITKDYFGEQSLRNVDGYNYYFRRDNRYSNLVFGFMAHANQKHFHFSTGMRYFLPIIAGDIDYMDYNDFAMDIITAESAKGSYTIFKGDERKKYGQFARSTVNFVFATDFKFNDHVALGIITEFCPKLYFGSQLRFVYTI